MEQTNQTDNNAMTDLPPDRQIALLQEENRQLQTTVNELQTIINELQNRVLLLQNLVSQKVPGGNPETGDGDDGDGHPMA